MKARTNEFFEGVQGLRYNDGSPIFPNPVATLTAIQKISFPFEISRLLSDLIDQFEKSGGAGTGPYDFSTPLLAKRNFTATTIAGKVFEGKQKSRIAIHVEKNREPCFRFFQEGLIPISEFIPKIERFVRIKQSDLEELASLAEAQNWTFVKEDGTLIPFGQLRYYLRFTFDRICADISWNKDCHEIVSAPDGVSNLFCTGLVTRKSKSFIYAKCTNPDFNGFFRNVSWVSREDSSQDWIATNHEELINHGLPYPANWTREPGKLVFDYRQGAASNIDFKYDHMFKDHIQRVQKRGFDSSGIGDKIDYDHFCERIRAAWPWTRKRLESNYKTAIATYYEGDIQLLVPLFLDDRKPYLPSAALVLKRNTDPSRDYHYIAPTFLTLDMARNDARVITRLDSTWLDPTPVERTLDWLRGELVDSEEARNQSRTDCLKKAIDGLTLLAKDKQEIGISNSTKENADSNPTTTFEASLDKLFDFK